MTKKTQIHSLFRNAYMAPIVAGLVGCATTQHHFDPETCKTWSETDAKTLILGFNSRTRDTFSDTCTEGKAGAQVTLIAQKNGKLNPVSASIGLEFLSIVRQKSTQERMERNQELADLKMKQMTSEQPSFPSTEEALKSSRSEEILKFFSFYLNAAGYNENDMHKAVNEALKSFIKEKEKQHPKCLLGLQGYICE